MSVIIDGNQAYKVFSPERGSVNVALRWFAVGSGEERPAMFLFPKPHVRKDGAGAFVIPLSLAFQYQSLDIGKRGDMRMVIQAANDAAKAMLLTSDKYTLTNICDVIFNYLPELIAMPPKRMIISKKEENAGPSMGELSIKVDGKVVHEQEVTAP
jgi:hypothetical protein